MRQEITRRTCDICFAVSYQSHDWSRFVISLENIGYHSFPDKVDLCPDCTPLKHDADHYSVSHKEKLSTVLKKIFGVKK